MADDQNKDKVPVSLLLDRTLLERIEIAIKRLPPGWDTSRVFEVGAVELLEKLAQKHNKGKPFSE